MLDKRSDSKARLDLREEPFSLGEVRFTTWHGVGFDVWHHGRSGIGYAGLPPTQSNVAIGKQAPSHADRPFFKSRGAGCAS